jgi:hypothetical protein
MPLRDLVCENCGRQQERFYHATEDPRCLPCAHCNCQTLTLLERSDEGRRRQAAHAVFPFVTTHIDSKGRPMTIESMGHLRQVEKEYGVALSVFANEHNNSLDHLKDPPTYRGWDVERGHRD